MASDYYCNYPDTTRSYKIFFLTLFGISIPTIFTIAIDSCLGNVIYTNKLANPLLTNAIKHYSLGGLLRESYYLIGFSKFCLVLLVFSILGNNIAINYSLELSL
ncbi:hypothetical protein DL95DRAFT_481601 [Leptodontidium sp. 2 PMI_412]|nr:hypothetical protein DL95DRAFT_481601 [Leptodontidium sp. 2 PMI_412]